MLKESIKHRACASCFLLIFALLVGCHEAPQDGNNLSNAQYQVPVFVRGDLNNWEASTPMSFVEGRYISTIILETGRYQFKIADRDWRLVDLGGEVDEFLPLGQSISLKPQGINLKLHVATPGTYSFALDAKNPVAPSLMVQVVQPGQ